MYLPRFNLNTVNYIFTHISGMNYHSFVEASVRSMLLIYITIYFVYFNFNFNLLIIFITKCHCRSNNLS